MILAKTVLWNQVFSCLSENRTFRSGLRFCLKLQFRFWQFSDIHSQVLTCLPGEILYGKYLIPGGCVCIQVHNTRGFACIAFSNRKFVCNGGPCGQWATSPCSTLYGLFSNSWFVWLEIRTEYHGTSTLTTLSGDINVTNLQSVRGLCKNGPYSTESQDWRSYRVPV